MPDTYSRESMMLALELQERCLAYLRAGGNTVQASLVSIVASEPPARGTLDEPDVDFTFGGDSADPVGPSALHACFWPESETRGAVDKLEKTSLRKR